nr:MAG TPA: hypothetical protein [Caudoviricetes sp.]
MKHSIASPLFLYSGKFRYNSFSHLDAFCFGKPAAFRFPHYIYTKINFCIYEKIFPHIRKFPSVYTPWNTRIYGVIFPRHLHSKAPRLQVFLRAGRLGF